MKGRAEKSIGQVISEENCKKKTNTGHGGEKGNFGEFEQEALGRRSPKRNWEKIG